MTRRASILVLNYNGKDLLAKYLPSVAAAAEHDGDGHEVVVVDNASSDDSVAFVRRDFPQVRVRQMPNNDRLYSYNQVVRECSNNYVILLNNDVRVGIDYLAPLLRHFEDPHVFAVMPRIDSDIPSERYISRCVGSFRHGVLGTGRSEGITGAGYSLYAHCASVYDRKKFLELGGLDRLYWPGYTEEPDICYQAWTKGWKVLFEPRSVVFHVGGQSMGKAFSVPEKTRILERGAMIFFLKCISDRTMLASWALWSFLRFGRSLLRGNGPEIASYFDVLRLLPQIIAQRRRVQAFRRISDREILQTLRKESKNAL